MSSTGNLRRREVLQLYRDILRACRRFHWTDHNGEMWGRVLARNARYEFEQARHEKDPEVIAQLLVGGRQALINVEEKVDGEEQRLFQNIHSSRTDLDPAATQNVTDKAEKYRREGMPEDWQTVEFKGKDEGSERS